MSLPVQKRRRHPAHGVMSRPDRPTVVFDTVCTTGRENVLATTAMHETILTAWRIADHWAVGRYVIMPDHVHYFATPKNEDTSFDRWVSFWKSEGTRRIGSRLWQPGHWDTRIRNPDQFSEKWLYVLENPVRAGLVETSDEWAFQGELYQLEWR